MSVSVSIKLLGGFRLSVAGRSVTTLPRKAEALLAYLAMQDGRPVTRESVSDLLWTDRGVEQARHSLRQTLLVLRREMPDAIGTDPRMLAFVPGMVETDIGRFRLLARGAERAELAEAAETYEGALLDRFPPVGGDFDDWLRTSRDELNDQAIEVMRRLVDACLAAGDVHPAVLAAERMVGLDLLREDSHRRMMEVYLRAGRRADAIRQYETCVEVLKRELDVGPSEETMSLATEARQHISSSSEAGVSGSTFHSIQTLARPGNGPPRIAILPFHALGPEPLPEHIGVGLVEDIIGLLAMLREPVVISSNSSQAYRERRPDLRHIGGELGVHYVVVGSLRFLSGATRVYVELSATETNAVLWARTYDAEGLAIFDVQDNIALRIVTTILPLIREQELSRIRTKRPEDLTAYDLVLRARELVLKLDRVSFEDAGRLLREACRRDARYAPAHAAMADWYSLLIGQGWSSNVSHSIASLDDAARLAIACDPNHSRALALYGHNRSFLHRDYAGAIAAFDQALEVTPNDAVTWKWTSTTFAYVGDGKEAARRAYRALELSPRDAFSYGFFSSLCVAHYVMGSYDEAIQWGQKSFESNSRYTSNSRYLCAALVAAGRVGEANEIARSILEIEPAFRVAPLVARHPIADETSRVELGNRLVISGLPA